MTATTNGILLIVLGAALAIWGVFIASTGTIPLVGVAVIALGGWAIISGALKARKAQPPTSSTVK